MKHSLCFLVGALVMTSTIIWAGGRPAGMFLAGVFISVVIAGSLVASIGLARVARFLRAFDEALHSLRGDTPDRRKKQNTPKSNVVRFQKLEKAMLRPVQQEVVSALVNLGMTMSKAERLICEVSESHPGLDFDTLFRLCVTPGSRTAHA
jgi:hypothetical protein